MTLQFSKPLVGFIVFLSLAANVFFGGMLVGKHVYGGPGDGKFGVLVSALKDLSPDSRGKAIDTAGKDWPKVQKQLEELRQKREAVKAILASPDYKQADLDKAFAGVRAAVDKTIEAGQGMVGDLAADLTPEERIKLVKSLQHSAGL